MPISAPPPSWASIKSKPTTVAGFGITDMATQVSAAEKCKAFVNFNGTGTVAIRASSNVSSITDNGVGDYTVNFATAMPDVNYSVGQGIVTNTGGGTQMGYTSGNTYTSSAFRFFTIQGDTKGLADPEIVNAQFFR